MELRGILFVALSHCVFYAVGTELISRQRISDEYEDGAYILYTINNTNLKSCMAACDEMLPSKWDYTCQTSRFNTKTNVCRLLLDLNECVTAGCEYKCKNYHGKYECLCQENAVLSEDGKTCISFTTATFTNLGSTGREGPTTIGSHYDGKEHEGLVTLTNGIQYFTIPATGDYVIEAVGAAGGCDTNGCGYRSYGAKMKATFRINGGTQLKILVGQTGGHNPHSSTGGGGGTFVTFADNTPLIVAGGGGGVETPSARHATCSASTGTSGNNGYAGSAWAGGSGGNGATTADSSNSGGGGGGLLTNGRSSAQYGGSGTGGEGGKAFVNGGVGGRSKYYPDAGYDADGGFGGGGGAYGNGGGAGGGGGYSGGASGDNNGGSCGGGGGSYIKDIGSNHDNVADYNNSHGYVTITRA